MVFFFFAVRTIAYFLAIQFAVSDSCHDTERNTFVSRPEQYVKVIAILIVDSFCIILAEFL